MNGVVQLRVQDNIAKLSEPRTELGVLAMIRSQVHYWNFEQIWKSILLDIYHQ